MPMNDEPSPFDGAARTGLAAVGLGVFAVACCAGAPLIAGVLGGIALGSVLGIAAGIVAIIGLTALGVIRTRRRRACAARAPAVEPGVEKLGL